MNNRRFSSTHASRGKLSRSEIPSNGEVVRCVVTTRLVVLRLTATVLTLMAALFLGFTVEGCNFRHRLLGLDSLLGGGHLCLLGLGIRGWSGGLDNTPPSDDVVPPRAQVPLLSRGTGPLSFRNDRVASGGALSGACLKRASFISFHFTQPW